MPESYAGYATHGYVKGLYVKYAADPKPVEFTGNIDDLSDEDVLLTKAMHVVRSQITGTLPNDVSNDFLIKTTKYGNSIYLQQAFTYDSDNECYEYRRVYAGEWSSWVSTDDSVKRLDKNVQSAIDLATNCDKSVTSLSGQVSSLKSDVKTAQNSIGSLSNTVGGLQNTVKTVNEKTTLEDASNKYTVSKTSGAWNCSAIKVKKFGNVVTVRVEFSIKKNVNVNAGSNAFVGTINAPAGYLPFFTSFLISCFTTSSIVAWIDGNGDFTVRVLNSAIKPGSDTVVGVGGTFIVGG